MDVRFLPHNAHQDGLAAFEERDPHLRVLRDLPLVHRPALLARLPRGVPGAFTVGGGRQIGKTTLLKLWMAELLKEGVAPERIAFFTGELIDDHHALVRLVGECLNDRHSPDPGYLILDEVTYIREWDRGVKYLADAGVLADTTLVLTGSDLTFLRQARMRFPGRRGPADVADFHVYPLSFREMLRLKGRLDEPAAVFDPALQPRSETISILFREFEEYLMHGGYLTAANDLVLRGAVRPSTFATYQEWVRGDMLRRGKQEVYLREVLGAIVSRYGSQVSWNSLARDLSIDHPQTVADYVGLLASMDAVYVQPALREDALAPAPKKARKILFTDPFIFHAIRSWLHPVSDPFGTQVRAALESPEWAGRLAEACVASHLSRDFPTYYIKAEGEVDVAIVREGRFWPIEVKWTGQLRAKDLKQIRKYGNGAIWGRVRAPGQLEGVPVEPLPLALARSSGFGAAI
ncbi:MAG: ATP-binding protein [Candidatus Sericytochromatia bacterium]|nr:ATP-binding protein [Candidatus Tanganyikabacteria bacterium]